MLNLKKIRRIRKAERGFSFPSFNWDFSVMPTTDPMAQKIKEGLTYTTNSSTLDTSEKEKNNIPYIDFNNLLSNFGNSFMLLGLISGNPTLMSLGSLSTVIPKFKDIKNLPKEEQTNAKLGLVGDLLDTGNTMLFSNQEATDSSLTTSLNRFQNTIGDALPGPYKTIFKTNAFIGNGLESLGADTDLLTTTDQIMSSNFVDPITKSINGFFGKKSDEFNVNADTEGQLGGAYMGTFKDAHKLEDYSNKKFGLFSSRARHKVNNAVADYNTMQASLNRLATYNKNMRDIAANMGLLNATNYSNKINGISFVKLGAKIPETIDLETKNIEWKPVITHYWEPVIVSYKEGGKTEEELETPEIEKTTLKNIIPEGALHKNKHHMENDKNITKKGIPVIDNLGELQAEIELNEIIFTLEVTKKLEDLYKIYFDLDKSLKEKDAAAIDAGKLLVKEILFNTDDRTGLINTLKEGGPIDITKDSFEVWFNSIPEKFRDNKYDYKLAYETLDWEELKNHALDPNKYHLHSVSPKMDSEGRIPFLKLKTLEENPELQGEFDFYNSELGTDIRNKFDIKYIKDRYYYVPKNLEK